MDVKKVLAQMNGLPKNSSQWYLTVLNNKTLQTLFCSAAEHPQTQTLWSVTGKEPRTEQRTADGWQKGRTQAVPPDGSRADTGHTVQVHT